MHKLLVKKDLKKSSSYITKMLQEKRDNCHTPEIINWIRGD
jgi:hypothetical protein